jgi:transposase
VLSHFRVARIVAETGPLSDFPNARSLLRYAGLNLRERKSGRSQGKVRLSKKGRVPLRRALGEAVFRLVRKGALYGDYYHAKKAAGVCGTKIIAALERKLLRMILALGKPGAVFDPGRVAVGATQYRPSAPAVDSEAKPPDG